MNNLNAYDGVEDLSNYRTKEEIELYKMERLERCVKFVKIIKKYFKHKINVVEIGSGSSALLYLLESKDMLNCGTGIEISVSRSLFAEKWKKDIGSEVKNFCGDFTDYPFHYEEDFNDCFLVVDNTFSYLKPENKRYPKKLLKEAFKSLVNNGIIIIEVNDYRRFLGTKLKKNFWYKFPDTNPFKYHLLEQSSNQRTKELTVNSIFIDREGKEKTKTEVSYIYTLDDLESLVEEAGFNVIDYDVKDGKLIIIGQK